LPSPSVTGRALNLARQARLVYHVGELVREGRLAYKDIDPQEHRQALVRRVGQGIGAGAPV